MLWLSVQEVWTAAEMKQ